MTQNDTSKYDINNDNKVSFVYLDFLEQIKLQLNLYII